MLVINLFSWWYGLGWLQFGKRLLSWIKDCLNFFSVGTLLRTLFLPYRQISVGRVDGSLGVKLRAWTDLQISRFIGAIIRLAVILFGLLTTVIVVIVSAAVFVFWPVMPVFPLLVFIFIVGS